MTAILTEAEVIREAYQAHGVFSGEKPHRIPVGFDCVDAAVGGVTPGDLVVFAARPNVGKTQALIHMSRIARSRGHKVGIISLEDSPIVLGERIQAFHSHVPSIEVRRNGYKYSKLKDSLAKAETDGIFFAFPELGNVTEIGVNIMEMKERGVEAVYVDYLQTIAPDGTTDMRAEFSKILLVLKNYARRFNVVVFLASQIARERLNERLGKYLHEPELNELAETSFIERKAELVHLAWKEDGKHFVKLAKNKFSLDAPRFLVTLNSQGMYETEVINEDSF